MKSVWRGFAFWFSALIIPAVLGYSAGKLSAQGNTTDIMIPRTHPQYGAAHPDLELYYQQRKAVEDGKPIPRPTTGYTRYSLSTVNSNQTGELVQGTEIIGAFADLGGTLGALGFASWLVVFLLRQHDNERQEMRKAFTLERERVQTEREHERGSFQSELANTRAEFATERNLHLQKDSQNDEALHASMTRSQEQLLTIVENNAKQVNDLKDIMTGHSNDLKQILIEMKMSVTAGFESVKEHWDGKSERRSTATTDRRRKNTT